MTEEPENRRIRVQDHRRIRQEDPVDRPTHLRPEVREAEEVLEDSAAAEELEVPAEPPAQDYLEDLRRLKAEFENFKKQNIKRQTEIVEQANVRLVGNLLPVLDDFERAAAHGEGGSSFDLLYKELRGVLETEGLSSIEAEGAVFDPNLHEAVETRASAEVDVDTVLEVYRTGYRFKDRVLRPAMVVVAHPDPSASGEATEG